MRHHQNCHATLLADAVEKSRRRGLIWQVKAIQRLVQNEKRWIADERLGDQEPLLLAAGDFSDRAGSELFGVNQLDRVQYACVFLSTPLRKSI